MGAEALHLDLARGKRQLASVITRLYSPPSETLLYSLDCALRSRNIRLAELDIFSSPVRHVNSTGLRIGLASVQGLADGLRKPCINR